MPSSVIVVAATGLALVLALIVAGILARRWRGRLLVLAALALVLSVASAATLDAFAAAIPAVRNVPAPLADSATLYFCSNDASAPNVGEVYAVNARTGATRWRHGVRGAVYDTTPVVGNGEVFIRVALADAGSTGLLVALSAQDGTERWHVQYPESQIRSVAVDGGMAFVNVTNIDRASLVAFRASDGTAVWNVTVPNVGFAGSSALPIAVAGGIVSFTPDAASVVGVREAEGTLAWRAQPASGAAPLTDMRADASGVYVIDNDSVVTALAASTGAVEWRFNANVSGGYVDASGLALSDAILYASVSHASSGVTSDLSALRLKDGAVLWQRALESPAGPPLLDGGAVYVPAGGSLTALRPADGTVLRSVDLGIAAPIALVNGVVFSYTRAVYHPYGLFGLFQRNDPHNYLTAQPANGDAPYWRTIAPALQGGFALTS